MTTGKWDWLKYAPWRIWAKITNFYYQRKYSVQRLFHGFGDIDIFEFYTTMASVILPRLIDYKKHHHGYPSIFSEYSENEWQKKEDYFTYVGGCKNPKAITILIHGGTEHVVDEIERAFMDGLGDVISVLDTRLVVPGGGAIEIELSRRLREFAQTLQGREQLAVQEYANALEFIPSTLSENAGLDPIDILTQLKAKHDAGEMNAGLNLFTNKVENVLGAKIIEPSKIKSQALSSASEVAIMILRIDDVIASKPNKKGRMNQDNFGNKFDLGNLS